MTNLFKKPEYSFFWQDIKTYLIRSQYNELLHFVVKEYYNNQYHNTSPLPRFLDSNYALTLTRFDDTCSCEDLLKPLSNTKGRAATSTSQVGTLKQTFLASENAYLNSKDQLDIAKRNMDNEFENFNIENTFPAAEKTEAEKLKKALEDQNKSISDADAIEVKYPFTGIITLTGLSGTHTALVIAAAYKPVFALLKGFIDSLEKAIIDFNTTQATARKDKHNFDKEIKKVITNHEDAKANLKIATRDFNLNQNTTTEKAKRDAEIDERAKGREVAILNKSYSTSTAISCIDIEANYFCAPDFFYIRKMSLPNPPTNFNIDFDTHGLTVGSVIWLYHYERMGIFKILGALLDDYNYRGKYTISGSRKSTNNNSVAYSTLMDMICTLHRLGIGSNLRDRICTYQRVLGVTIENNLGIESEQNTGFMQTFNKLLDYMLEYYKAKQLAQAIQSQNGGVIQPRSSVATQTSILDTLNLMQQQFEPMQYGRNQINTFLGIATVHATICLVNMLKAEIGIPTQYEKPEEFIPAAYDILVAKRPVTLNEVNRFIIHDNCASYGYRLLTDIETADINQLTTIASGATLDVWLNDVEGWVEGYRNAFKSISEPASAIV